MAVVKTALLLRTLQIALLSMWKQIWWFFSSRALLTSRVHLCRRVHWSVYVQHRAVAQLHGQQIAVDFASCLLLGHLLDKRDINDRIKKWATKRVSFLNQNISVLICDWVQICCCVLWSWSNIYLPKDGAAGFIWRRITVTPNIKHSHWS